MKQDTGHTLEKRWENRLNSALRVEVVEPSTKRPACYNGLVRNISRNGFSVRSEAPLTQDNAYRFKITLDDDKVIHALGRVVRTRSNTVHQFSGISIKSLSLLNRLKLNWFLAHHLPTGRKNFGWRVAGFGLVVGFLATGLFGVPFYIGFLSALLISALLVIWAPF